MMKILVKFKIEIANNYFPKMKISKKNRKTQFYKEFYKDSQNNQVNNMLIG